MPSTRVGTKDELEREIVEHQKAYHLSFSGADIVLADLGRFCHAADTCFDADPRIHAVYEGRREVWLRIQDMMNLTVEQIFDKRTRLLTKETPSG